jgi:serine/threonine protein kinase
VVTLLGVNLKGPERFMMTEYLPRGSLRDFIHKESHLLNERIRWKIAKCVANGMNYLHSYKPLPILHRDLNPSNILLEENLNAKVSDFGLSRFKKESGSMTVAVGSCAYMAPEVFRGEKYNEKADVYGFGIVCWEMCTCADPCCGEKPPVVASKAALENWRPPLNNVSSKMGLVTVQQPWRYLIESCWASNPNSRPSFQQILQFLEQNAPREQ